MGGRECQNEFLVCILRKEAAGILGFFIEYGAAKNLQCNKLSFRDVDLTVCR